jgi:hypothetical protein
VGVQDKNIGQLLFASDCTPVLLGVRDYLWLDARTRLACEFNYHAIEIFNAFLCCFKESDRTRTEQILLGIEKFLFVEL